MSVQTKGITKVDLLNAKSVSLALQDNCGSELTIRAFAISTTKDAETGEPKEVAYLFAEDGAVYGAISATILETVSDIIEFANEGEINLPLIVRAESRKNKAGSRDFISLRIIGEK